MLNIIKDFLQNAEYQYITIFRNSEKPGQTSALEEPSALVQKWLQTSVLT